MEVNGRKLETSELLITRRLHLEPFLTNETSRAPGPAVQTADLTISRSRQATALASRKLHTSSYLRTCQSERSAVFSAFPPMRTYKGGRPELEVSSSLIFRPMRPLLGTTSPNLEVIHSSALR
jgi:hypothetical protein